MKKFYIKSLGCKQNALEGQIIASNLKNSGYIEVNNIKDADIFILNSCTVTSHTDSSVNYLLNSAKKNNPNIKTVLTGCVAQTYKQHKSFDYEKIDLILGNSEKMQIEKYIENLFKNEEKFFVEDIFKVKTFENQFLKDYTTSRASIKIQDGCNNRCSYCIIPYARGNSRSNSINNIIKQIKLAQQNNIKEIVLTGIHIGQWGLENNQTLLDLLVEIEKTSIPRYRLGSLYVNEIDDKLINFLKKSDKFCPHFHLSLQSLCDKTLKNMNRSYTSSFALKTIEKLKNVFELPFLGCDIIVGFPDETDEDFNITYNNLKKAELSSIHCFPYSKRENTPAFFMKNQIQNKIKTQRTEKIIELSNILHKNFLEQNKNTIAEVLVEKKSPKTGLYSAVTRNYIKIYIKSDKNIRYSLKTVNLRDYELM